MSGLRLPDRDAWIVGLATTVSLAGQSSGPWVLAAIAADPAFGLRGASLIVAAELVATGLTMLSVAPFVRRLMSESVAMFALGTIVVAEAASALTSGWLSLVAIRCIAGVAFGVLFSAANGRGAATPLPEKTYAFAGATALVIGTAINPLLATAAAAYGRGGAFLALALYCLLVGVPLAAIRFPALPYVASTKTESAPILVRASMGVMALMGLLAVATNGVFVFVPMIAGRLGLKGTELGAAMSLVSLLSSLGAVAAGRLGTRLGRSLPLTGGLMVMGGALFWVTVASSQLAFWAALTMLVLTYWFLYPYMLGLAVDIDPEGRLAAATGSAKILAGGAGSAAAGAVSAAFGLPGYGLVALVACLAAGVLALFVVRWARVEPPKGTGATPLTPGSISKSAPARGS